MAEERTKTAEWTLSEEQLQLLSSEESCADVLFAAKWPDGFRCTHCGHLHAYKITTRRLPLFECSSCHYQESLTANTIFEGSRSDLRKWFHALLIVSHTTCGINAVQLSEAIGVTYKTAWLMLHKIRYAMSKADAGMMLSGIVRINSALNGRPHNPSVNRHIQEQPLLVGASLNAEGEPVYVKIKRVPDDHLEGKVLKPIGNQHFIEQYVEPKTDDLESITARFSSRRFQRLLTIAKKAGQWINATYHGIGPKHLQAYLNEYCCRLNLDFQGGAIFRYLTQLCAAAVPVTYPQLIRFPTTS
ncbi:MULTISPECIES: transposase [unclassified Paenibacillus]|uniref:transposase n=1 Tax=unclassified Paenibacillus TaxID=185978 RepID=UPI0036438465